MSASLDSIRERADRAGVFVDFDGTLSEIAPTPEAAVAVPGAPEALAALARRFAVVAVVSGRPVAEVRAKLGAPDGVRWFGLYGLDEEGGAGGGTGPDVPGTPSLLPMLGATVEDLDGIRLEPKGPTVAVHYRDARDPEAVRSQLLARLEVIAADADLRLIEGKRVVELAPRDAPSKGDVIRRQGRGLEALLYAGDDLADLAAFGAVDEAVAAGAEGLKIAVRSRDAPRELVGVADLVIEGPSELVALFRRLAG